MNLFKRAWWRIGGHPGKTLMLVGLFFVICTLVLSGFLIQSAAARAAADAKQRVGAVATMQLDINALMESGKMQSQGGGATPGLIGKEGDLHRDLVDKICKSPVVKQCNYTTDSGAAPTASAKLYQPVPAPPGQDTLGTDFFKADGVRDLNSVANFRNGDSKIVSGSGIGPGSKGDAVVVEERMAKQNKLKVGDKVKLKVGELPPPGEKPNTDEHEFTVVGIYKSSTADTGKYVPAITNPANQLYVTPEGATTLLGKDPAQGATVKQATFTLGDPADIDRLKKDAEAAGADLKIFPLSVNDKQYKTLVGPITRTAGFATVTVWLVAVAGTAILALVVASSLRERRKELGILLSLGEKKTKLLGQHLVEVVACALLAIGLSAAGSQFLSQGVGNWLLAGEVSSAKDDAANADSGRDHSSVTGPGGPSPDGSSAGKPEVDPIDRIDVRLGPADIGKVGATGLGIAALATLVPGIRVLRLNPRDILVKGD